MLITSPTIANLTVKELMTTMLIQWLAHALSSAN
jgi:hypothetical protein